MFASTSSALLLVICATQIASAQQIKIDAVSQPPAPETGFIKQGSSISPTGHRIGINSRYLTKDGEPWLPVMGEFHYSRYPRSDWDAELKKMKAAGVDVVASYVIWIHHEEAKGTFEWSGQKDLRDFVRLVAKNGMHFVVRIGPWSHAEVRNGGFPDWLVKEVGNDRLRSNDTTYIAYTARFYRQIAQQLNGLLWKDGGPIIAVQLENEYNLRGDQKGEGHILKLKELAVDAGLDAPFYTVTGWDNTVWPQAEVVPVFGGYEEMPWDSSIEELPPSEVYAFRFENRWAGNMGAMNADAHVAPTSQDALKRYPFLGAEYGGGIQMTYHRRPVISANDIAAMLPVQIGSGVNLYGYYMFHGGTNPQGKFTTLNESQRTGYPNDLPVRSYDFQALLGEFGQVRASLDKVKLVHYFLNQFGERLAPMVVRKPDAVPANALDTSVLRVSARTLGDRGFIFVNNYIRNYHMPARHGVQFEVALPHGTVRVPQKPIDIPSGVYFIWPVNLDMNGAQLRYATAQLIREVDGTWYFLAIPGIKPEFVFDGAKRAKIVVLTEAQAIRMWGPHQTLVPQRVSFAKVRGAGAVPAVKLYSAVTWRKNDIALVPSDSAWAQAARYRITLPSGALKDHREWLLEIGYVGDVARLYAGDVLLDDNFYNGTKWQVGLKRFAAQIKGRDLELRVLPLRADAPIYLPVGRPRVGQAASVSSVLLYAVKPVPSGD